MNETIKECLCNGRPDWHHRQFLRCGYLRIIGMGYLFNISLIVCSNLLRCAGDTKTPMKFNILTNIINVVGNYLLIYPSKEIQLFGKNFLLQRAGLGVSGAAAATSKRPCPALRTLV